MIILRTRAIEQSLVTRPLIKTLQRNLARALSADKLAEAESILASLQREDAISLPTRGYRLELLVKKGELAEAEALAAQLLQLFPESGRVHFLAGRAAYRRRDYLSAIERFRESARIYPHWRASWWLGKALTQAGVLDEAEALLLKVAEQHPHARRDLAWLYERRGSHGEALAMLESYLADHPPDELTHEQLVRLRARAVPAEELVEEVETLLDLGELASDALLPEYVQTLLESGESAKARRLVQSQLERWSPRLVTRVAWVCHRLQAYDLAWQLFSKALPANLTQVKLLSALEACARHCKRETELIELYEAHAASNRNFYGRIARLRRRIEG